MRPREYYLQLIHTVTANPYVVGIRLNFDEVTDTECRIRGAIDLVSGLTLYVSEYTQTESAIIPLKYRYHLQSAEGAMLVRWDNAPHHHLVSTFPHHMHTEDEQVLPSEVHDLFDVLQRIDRHIPTK